MSVKTKNLGLVFKFALGLIASTQTFGVGVQASTLSPHTAYRTDSGVLKIASRKTAEQDAQIKKAEASLGKAVNRLENTDEFKRAVEKKDSRALSRMIQSEAGVDFPIRVNVSGEGAASKIKVKVTVECCPLKGVVTVEF